MKDYKLEVEARVQFICSMIESAGADGIVYGNSGGKDSALVGILCKMACDNTLGLIMPCGTKRNYETDKIDAEVVAKLFDIAVRVVDLSGVRRELCQAVGEIGDAAIINIAPRLRMTLLYAIANSENRLVAGTGNRSESYRKLHGLFHEMG